MCDSRIRRERPVIGILADAARDRDGNGGPSCHEDVLALPLVAGGLCGRPQSMLAQDADRQDRGDGHGSLERRAGRHRCQYTAPEAPDLVGGRPAPSQHVLRYRLSASQGSAPTIRSRVVTSLSELPPGRGLPVSARPAASVDQVGGDGGRTVARLAHGGVDASGGLRLVVVLMAPTVAMLMARKRLPQRVQP